MAGVEALLARNPINIHANIGKILNADIQVANSLVVKPISTNQSFNFFYLEHGLSGNHSLVTSTPVHCTLRSPGRNKIAFLLQPYLHLLVPHTTFRIMDQREVGSLVKALTKAVQEKQPSANIITILESLKNDVVATEELLRVCASCIPKD